MNRFILLLVPLFFASACKPDDCRGVEPWYDYPGQTFTFELRSLTDHPYFDGIDLPACDPPLDLPATFTVTQTADISRPSGQGCPLLTGDSDLFAATTTWLPPPEATLDGPAYIETVLMSAFYLSGETTRADGCFGYYTLIITPTPTAETGDSIFTDPAVGTQAYWYADIIFEPITSCAAPTSQGASCVEFFPAVLTSIAP